MKNKRKLIFLILILLTPVLIFLFLKGLGTNQFDIPVYYTEGVPPDQRHHCYYPEGPYRVVWPSNLEFETPAAIFVVGESYDNNMVRRIGKNHETGVQVYLLDSLETSFEGVAVQNMTLEERTTLLRCSFASDTLNQWILVDEMRRIRGYYNTSLEEQDRLLNEMSILMSN